MIRWYLSKYIGTGTFLDQYRSGIDDLIGPGESSDGLDNPIERYYVKRVSASKETHDKILEEGYGVPLTPLSESEKEDDWNAIKLEEKTAVMNELSSIGVDSKVTVDLATSPMEMVRKLLYSARLAQIAKRTSQEVTKKQIDTAAVQPFLLAKRIEV